MSPEIAAAFALAALKGLSHLAPHAHVLRLKNEGASNPIRRARVPTSGS